jgi:hypothetical protein
MPSIAEKQSGKVDPNCNFPPIAAPPVTWAQQSEIAADRQSGGALRVRARTRAFMSLAAASVAPGVGGVLQFIGQQG